MQVAEAAGFPPSGLGVGPCGAHVFPSSLGLRRSLLPAELSRCKRASVGEEGFRRGTQFVVGAALLARCLAAECEAHPQ